jgi:outer membrane protein TolC
MIFRFILIAILLLPTFFLSGCFVRPTLITENQITERIDSDLTDMHQRQEPTRAPISLHEATARALSYNLDYRLKMMEEALYQKNFELSRFDMLPRLLATAGYGDRSNDYGGRSMSLITGNQSLESSTSQEKDSTTLGVGFSWNILDLGISYYRAKQQADQYMISQERRRKVIQNVMQDVRSAYYRALAAQKLIGKCDTLLGNVRTALISSEAIEGKGLMPPAQALTYQRTLLDTTNLLIQKRRELQLAKTELAALMNIPQGADFMIADTPLPEPMPIPNDMIRLERAALLYRPELREEDYKDRISQDEAKRLLVSVLPGIQLDAGFQYNSNDLLANNSWFQYGAQASWNLMRILSLPKLNEMNNFQGDVNKMRRAALTMAIVTQVRLGVQRYDMAIFDYDLSSRASTIDDKLLKHIQSGAKAGSENELDVIRTNTKALLSEIQKYNAYSNVQAAYARLLNSVGLDLLPPANDVKDIAGVAAYMKDRLTEWDSFMKDFVKPQLVSETRPLAPTPVNSIEVATEKETAKSEGVIKPELVKPEPVQTEPDKPVVVEEPVPKEVPVVQPAAVAPQTVAPLEQDEKVTANKDSRLYHLPGMKYHNRIRAFHRVDFDTEEEAIKAGYRKAPR